MLLIALVLSKQLIIMICTTDFRREKRNNVISYQLLSWKYIKESQWDFKQSVADDNNECIDRHRQEGVNIQQDEDVLLVYNVDNSLRKVCNCDPQKKDLSLNFDLVEEVDEDDEGLVRQLETVTYKDRNLEIRMVNIDKIFFSYVRFKQNQTSCAIAITGLQFYRQFPTVIFDVVEDSCSYHETTVDQVFWYEDAKQVIKSGYHAQAVTILGHVGTLWPRNLH